MKYRENKIVYSINVADLQDVSERVLERRLTDGEIAVLERSLGDFIDWFSAIENAINRHIDVPA
jgi:hypothetical protein